MVKDMGDLTGRVAIVTGAGNGLGKAYAIALARSGVRVVRLPEEHGRFAGVAGNEVHMEMEYGLPGNLIVVLHDIEAVAGKHIRHVGRSLLRKHQNL